MYSRGIDIVFRWDGRHRGCCRGCGGHCESRRVLWGTFRERLLAREKAYFFGAAGRERSGSAVIVCGRCVWSGVVVVVAQVRGSWGCTAMWEEALAGAVFTEGGTGLSRLLACAQGVAGGEEAGGQVNKVKVGEMRAARFW